MESILKDAIMAHLEKYELTKESQDGFTRGEIMRDEPLRIFIGCNIKFYKGRLFDVIILDSAKAFDKLYDRFFDILRWWCSCLTTLRHIKDN